MGLTPVFETGIKTPFKLISQSPVISRRLVI